MNGIILVDKPEDWTSHDVVSKLRGILHEKRIGHSGTLDPMATGLLVVFVGRATRAVEFAEADSKEYIAGLRLGTVTDTQDITGNVLKKVDIIPSVDEVKAVLGRFKGEQSQIPPMYSAIKVGGKKLYELARRGETVERKPRKIFIHELELIGERDGDLLLRVKCSKGTYIRTLCDDIGKALGCGACMSYLRRTRAGVFSVENAHSLEEIQNLSDSNELNSVLIEVHTLFSDKEKLKVSKRDEIKLRNGNIIPTKAADGVYRAFSESGEFLLLGEAADGSLKTVKSFFEPK